MILEFDIRDGMYHYATRTKDGCVFYSQEFTTKIAARTARETGELVNQVKDNRQ